MRHIVSNHQQSVEKANHFSTSIFQRSFNRSTLYLLIILLSFGGVSCKSSKKAAEKAKKEAEAAEADRVAKVKTKLIALLNDERKLALVDKEKELNDIKAMNIQNPEIKELISQVEEQLNREREGLSKGLDRDESKDIYQRVENYFTAITNSSSPAAANNTINEALGLFTTDNVPVLIIINKSGNDIDYDKPTTIRKYLEYLKDQKKRPDVVENLVVDSSGRIKEVVLIKK